MKTIWTKQLLSCLLVSGVVWGLSLLSAQAGGVELKNGKKYAGKVSAKSDGTILVITKQGNFSFPANQVARARADEPAEYKQAITALDSGKHAQAIKLAKGIAAQYKFLEWDNRARVVLIRAQTGKGDHTGALRTYDAILASDEKLADNSEVRWAYLGALVGAEKVDDLNKVIDDLIANGDRADAAKGQLLRGDLAMKRSQFENAVLDYLRTAVLFEKQTAQHPEALYKAAEALEKLRDARAATFYNKVIEQYPSSEFAAKAKSKI